jgi:hypothetical protein
MKKQRISGKKMIDVRGALWYSEFSGLPWELAFRRFSRAQIIGDST